MRIQGGTNYESASIKDIRRVAIVKDFKLEFVVSHPKR